MSPLVKRVVLAITALAVLTLSPACGGDDDGGDSSGADAGLPDAGTPFTDCDGSDEAFVRQAALALLGRRTLSQGELRVYADLMKAVREKGGNTAEAKTQAERVVAHAMMKDPSYNARWQRHFLDRLRVQRIDDQSMRGCYGAASRPADGGELAMAVRDADPRTDVAGGSFTMRDLLQSSIALDDLSPIYRGNLFVLVSQAIPAANVPPVEAELARRADFGNTFDAVYLNRDIVCLGCHNSEFSTTYREDPAENRHWALPGLFEKSLYGISNGIDPNRAHAVFRYEDFVSLGGGGQRPWGWADACGSFQPDGIPPDPADVDARFGGIVGKTVTVYDLEASLRSGFATLRAEGLVIGQDGEIADPDVAFAYLTVMNLVDGVWTEVTGNSLVIANYFPRNQAQRDELKRLTDNFIAADFSLRALLADILTSPYFNRSPATAGCGSGPYAMPAIYDPWVISDADAERRGNGAGDAIHPLTTRTAVSAAYEALSWPSSPLHDFPAESDCDQASCQELGFYCSQFGACCGEKVLYCDQMQPRPDPVYAADERAFQRATGHFLKNAERGFRGLDFQARLEWENRFGLCRPPAGLASASYQDFVDELVAVAAAAPSATLRDVVLALKDRVLAEAFVDDTAEKPLLEAMLGASLDTPASQVADLEGKVRRVCGALMSSPQFLLSGSARQEADAIPLLTPAELAYQPVCQAVAARGLTDGLTLTCADGSLTIE